MVGMRRSPGSFPVQHCNHKARLLRQLLCHRWADYQKGCRVHLAVKQVSAMLKYESFNSKADSGGQVKKPHLAALRTNRDQLFIRQLQNLPSSLRLGHDVDFDRGAVRVVCWELDRGVSAAVDSDLEVLGDWRVILGYYIEVYLPGETGRPNRPN